MYWAYGQRRGGHNSQGVARAGDRWYLAEGVTGFFDTFVLITNSSATPADVEVTFLRESGAPITTPVHDPGERPQDDLRQPGLPADSVALLDRRPPDQRRDRSSSSARCTGTTFEGGHESTAVTAPNTTWLFAEGSTGGNATFDFQTYLLLANPGGTPADGHGRLLPRQRRAGAATRPTSRPTRARRCSLDDLDVRQRREGAGERVVLDPRDEPTSDPRRALRLLVLVRHHVHRRTQHARRQRRSEQVGVRRRTRGTVHRLGHDLLRLVLPVLELERAAAPDQGDVRARGRSGPGADVHRATRRAGSRCSPASSPS